ncbi:MAG: hypothetical protein QF664_07100 [Dehalococcoidia bacterium]|jgi:hypothetical protein|nr:hypothetical protein [Dehalococcoidia bacterium]
MLPAALVPVVIALAMLVVLAGALLLSGCGASDPPAPRATASPTTAAPAGATALPGAGAVSLREVDFASPAVAADLINRAGGGEVNVNRVVYEDLTGDGREEAVVVVESGGTAGDLAVAVYRLTPGGAALVMFERLGGRVEVRLGLVVTQEGVYADDDARCCPSRLRERAYGWRDSAFTLISEQVVDNSAR